ncbi:MAG: hypothetical protein EA340_07915 [Nitriliruptor sp.]|nr:MAG: hypothetical protein EA340_07915 [Nitriliruptor sp.]
MEGVVSVSTRSRGNWFGLVAVAVLMAGAMFPVGVIALMTLEAVTWQLWDPAGDPPLWLNLMVTTVMVVLVAVPGAVVGLIAGLRRWWVVLVMAMSALVGVGVGALVLLLAAEGATPVGVAAGSVVGSLAAVALADRLGGGALRTRNGAAGLPVRSHEGG